MVAGADSIDDLALLRHGGMGKLFARIYAPSTLGSFLRMFRFGHVRQLDAVAARFLYELTNLTPVIATSQAPPSPGFAFVDVDDTVVQVHGHAKQGAGFGYNHIRGLNALLATLTVPGAGSVIVAQRLRKGACASARGGKRLVADAVKTSGRLLDAGTPVLVRMDSAFYGRNPVHAALTGGAQVSVTARMDPRVKAAIASIDDQAWTAIEYTDAVFDDTSGQWISRAEVAEITFTAFAAQPKADHVSGRLIVRRIPDPGRAASCGRAGRLVQRVAVPRVLHHHRPPGAGHRDRRQDSSSSAIIEQVHADLEDSALAHLPSGVFAANAAWLVLAVIAFNLTRAAATLAAPVASDLVRATTATVRRTLVQIPCRIATRAR